MDRSNPGLEARARRLIPPRSSAGARSSTVREVGCATCHAGDKLTNNTTVDVGTGEAFQVPSLRGVAYRAPYMHRVAPKTLERSLRRLRGGDQHGKTSSLNVPQRANR